MRKSKEALAEQLKAARLVRFANKPPLGSILACQKARIATRSPKDRNLLHKCFLRLVGPMQAIKCLCIECQGGDRKGVTDCGDRCCPLWRYRPFAKKRPITSTNDSPTEKLTAD